MVGKFIVGVAMIVHQDGKILLGKRAAGNFGAGLWEFPSGRLEPGESPHEGILREGMEELNLTLHPVQIIDAYTFKRGNEDLILINILCNYSGNLKISDEHEELKWVQISELDKYFSYDSQLATVKKLKQYLQLFQKSKQLQLESDDYIF